MTSNLEDEISLVPQRQRNQAQRTDDDAPPRKQREAAV
jgi:hypothetical protein